MFHVIKITRKKYSLLRIKVILYINIKFSLKLENNIITLRHLGMAYLQTKNNDQAYFIFN
jgi:hypothetical protein